MSQIKLTECPRDAMQGLKDFIPTDVKVNYINQVLKCGFDTVDFGSFVSAKAIPQMQDTSAVLEKLDLVRTRSKLLAIIANERGATEALQHEEITYLGFPFSLSETFQQRNTNSSIAEAFQKLGEIQELTKSKNRELIVYLSMGFGNPYGDPWNSEIVGMWSEKIHNELGVRILALSDTIGCADPNLVSELFSSLIPAFPGIEFGAHLHTLPEDAEAIVHAAYESGCRRFDGAIRGFGGCPMAKNDLTGNMPTEKILSYLDGKQIQHEIDREEFSKAYQLASSVFPIH